jgi:hypothetical protein
MQNAAGMALANRLERRYEQHSVAQGFELNRQNFQRRRHIFEK